MRPGATPTDAERAKARKTILAVLAKGGTVTAAAAKAGLNRSTVYDWKAADPAFKVEYDDALAAGADVLEAEVWRRAVKGVVRPIVSQGRIVTHVREYSDTLTLALLKAKKPEEYQDRSKVDLNGGITVNLNGKDADL